MYFPSQILNDVCWFGVAGNLIWEMECGSCSMVRKNKNVGLGPEPKDATSNRNFRGTHAGKMKLSTLELSKNTRSNASITERLTIQTPQVPLILSLHTGRQEYEKNFQVNSMKITVLYERHKSFLACKASSGMWGVRWGWPAPAAGRGCVRGAWPGVLGFFLPALLLQLCGLVKCYTGRWNVWESYCRGMLCKYSIKRSQGGSGDCERLGRNSKFWKDLRSDGLALGWHLPLTPTPP